MISLNWIDCDIELPPEDGAYYITPYLLEEIPKKIKQNIMPYFICTYDGRDFKRLDAPHFLSIPGKFWAYIPQRKSKRYGPKENWPKDNL